MSDLNHQPKSDRLDRATEELRTQPLPPGPSEDLIATTLAAMQNLPSNHHEVATSNRRKIIMRTIQWSAAGIAVAVLAGLLFIGSSSAAAFTKAMENAEKKKSLTHDLKQKILGREMPSKLYVREKQMRMELLNPDSNTVKDLPVLVAMVYHAGADKGVQINFTDKTYTPLTVAPNAFGVNLLEQFSQLKKKEAEEVGTEKIGDINTKIYKINNPDFMGMKPSKGETITARVWIDTKTDLPAKIVIEDKNLELTFENFQWDKELDEKLFQVEPVEGFKLKEANR